MNTLTYGATVVTLPDDIQWTDEFAWSSVVHSRRTSAAGAQIVDIGVRLAGRPFTLAGEATSAWVQRSVVLQLQGIAETAGAEMVLNYRGVNYDVMFDCSRNPLDATPIVDYADPDTTDDYFVVLRLIGI